MKSLAILLAAASVAAAGQRMVLLDVARGEMPPDALAKVALSEEHPEKEGGVSLKVTFDGSFGTSNARKKDWTGFRYVKFYAFNPQDKPLPCYFAIRDKHTVGWDTRADIPFTLQPGANNVLLDLATLKRNRSDLPIDMTAMNQWYIASETKGAVAYFGTIALESDLGEPKEPKSAPEGKTVLEAQVAGKKLVLEGRIRIELDKVEIEGQPNLAPTQAPALKPPEKRAERLVLLDANAGQPPSDHTAEVAISEDHAKELGGKSVKVVFKGGQAFGVGYWGAAGPANWQPYGVMRFEAFNPSKDIVALTLSIRDQKPGYENRCDIPFRLTPGLNKVEIPIQTLTSNAGNQLNKAGITHWYIASEADATLYFANFRLEKE